MVEHQLPKLRVAGSSPVSRSTNASCLVRRVSVRAVRHGLARDGRRGGRRGHDARQTDDRVDRARQHRAVAEDGGDQIELEEADQAPVDRPNDDKKGEEGEKDGGNKPKDGESPEEAARRILRENADFEKGALTPGRLEYRQPEKDW